MDEDVELIGGVEKRDIRVVEYDPAWPELFRAERERIAAALGATARRVEHIGSTAVPGLAAKSVVDICVGVPDVSAESTWLAPLQRAGYQLRVREPGHRMLRTPARDVHVHVCDVGSAWERDHLLFRDRLRDDESDRARYAQLKRELVGRGYGDMNAYSDAKGPLIGEILARAEAWARSRGGYPAGDDAASAPTARAEHDCREQGASCSARPPPGGQGAHRRRPREPRHVW